MTSRERVINAIEHKPTDRMPIDLGMHFSTGISAFAYYNLREYLGLPTDSIEVADCVQMLARVDGDILERFHVDTMLLNPPWPAVKKWNPRGKYTFNVPMTFNPRLAENGAWHVIRGNDELLMPDGGYFFDGGWPDFYGLGEDEKIELFAGRAELIYKETDKFTMLMGFNAFFHDLEFACQMLTDPDLCVTRQEALLIQQTDYFNKVNARMGQYINAVEINSDLGMQTGPMCSPASYEEFCYPYLKRFCAHIHNTSDIKIFMHSCGSIASMLPMIVSAGVDIINPVQISAAGMDPKELKRKFGGDICFWGGGCDTQTALWSYAPDEITRHVKGLIKIFNEGGGFVFNQVHNIMGNVPPRNIVAMYDAAYGA